MTIGPRAETLAELVGRGDAALDAAAFSVPHEPARSGGSDRVRESVPPAATGGLRTKGALPTMFIAMNRFRVRKGAEQAFEEVWLNREVHLRHEKGFVEFHLLAGPSRDDHTLYASHTVWETEEDFVAWTRSQAFRDAHKNAGSKADLYLEGPQFEGFRVLQTVAREPA